MFIVHGTHDQVVPFDQSLALFHALTQHDIPAQFVTYTGGYSFGGVAEPDTRAIWAQTLAYFVAQEQP